MATPIRAARETADTVAPGFGSPYQFLNWAYEHPDALLAQPALVRAAVEVLAGLGLGGPAREMLATYDGPEAQALRLAVRTVPIGRVPWTEREHILNTNLAPLLAMRPPARRTGGATHWKLLLAHGVACRPLRPK